MPVVYQIRLGGSKGVLSLDRTLSRHQICLRPSMTKFTALNTHLELANKGRTLPFFLNGQLIVILETLGLLPQNFIELQDREVQRLEVASRDFDEALRLCQNYGLGQASRLPKILTTLSKEGAIGIFDMPFFKKLNELALSHALKEIKYRSRIAVENSWVLMGVMDEFEILGADEIYICLKDEADGTTKVITRSSLECPLFIAATYRRLTQLDLSARLSHFRHYTTALSSPQKANVLYPICWPAATSMVIFFSYLKILSFSPPNGKRLHRILLLNPKISCVNVQFKTLLTFSSISS
jgi:hypothetical protein